jgi:mannose-6-phosphate isomerase
MQPYAMRFDPIFKPRIWGGQMLHTHFGKPIPTDIRIGESWELADLPDDKTQIGNGLWSRKTWSELPEEIRRQWFADLHPSKPFPLLIKLLDAQDVLSVQVHPDRETCKRMGHGDPKTECWFILAAGPDAAIYKGLRPGTTRDLLKQAIREGTVADLLCRVPVRTGECHFIPAGTCHAIGAGLLIAEIQTPSDTTYRVFDWNRLDDRGKPRPLHIQEALESIHYAIPLSALTVRSQGIVADCDHFSVELITAGKGQTLSLSSGETRVAVVVSGDGQILNPDQSKTLFRPGDTLLIPAIQEALLQFISEGHILVSRIKSAQA